MKKIIILSLLISLSACTIYTKPIYKSYEYICTNSTYYHSNPKSKLEMTDTECESFGETS